MDMGFWPDVRRIVAALPPSSAGRQTLLFSATMPNEVVRDAFRNHPRREIRAGRSAERAAQEHHAPGGIGPPTRTKSSG